MSAYSAYNMNTLLLTTLFRMAPNSSKSEKENNPDENLSNKAAIKVSQSIFQSSNKSSNDFKDEFRHQKEDLHKKMF